MLRFSLLLLFLHPLPLRAQFVAPPASQAAVAAVTVGYTDLGIDYHRPSVHGRIVFGELQPFGTVWRAGANENTLLRTSRDVWVDNHRVPAGTYSVYLMPRENAPWTWILNSDTTHWGATAYDPRYDVLRYDAPTARLMERTETLEYRWMDLRHDRATLALEWEWYRVRLPFTLATHAQLAEAAERLLSPATHSDDYYEVARYYLESDSVARAKEWIDRWAAAAPPQFGRTRRRALIEWELGNESLARSLLDTSLQLARSAGNDHYVRLNEQTLRDWTRTPLPLPADSLLAASIAYHDPESRWLTEPHALRISESRPGGGDRYTRLLLNPGGGPFTVERTGGGGQVTLEIRQDGYAFTADGQSVTDDSLQMALNLTPDRVKVLRDYYGYLWGLPMKLRDPGTLISPTVYQVYYHGQRALEIEVRYRPETGGDVWHFLFDPDTFALIGYRFYHDRDGDGPGTGEYILLEDEVLQDGIRFPARRHWYRTADKLFLGTDTLLLPGKN
ncbi:DUF6503 family protein [Lewinella sp. IMCC34183]|uniref:DUF6503 family protein n=1 Tax=Lewinella sp. IMCC34183 TaxID=2248762 RepID=UPI000E2786A4|nr:DUF6503 family protein [Lewinella sp. IMCC34183]